MVHTVVGKKKCPHCGEYKELFLFPQRGESGIQSWCIVCKNICQHEYYLKNRENINEWRRNNREKLREKEKIYQQNNRKKRNEYQFIYHNKKMKDPMYRLSQTISSYIRTTLKYKGIRKNNRCWESLVGYTKKELMTHLESLFLDGMTWDNYGKWHVDHIIPISVFNYESIDHLDFKRCWTLKNLRPLWAKENLQKNDKLKEAFQPSLAL